MLKNILKKKDAGDIEMLIQVSVLVVVINMINTLTTESTTTINEMFEEDTNSNTDIDI
jgi:hypothetical protein